MGFHLDGLAAERTHVETFPGSPPQYKEFVAEFGETNTALIGTAGWSRDGRDSAVFGRSEGARKHRREGCYDPS